MAGGGFIASGISSGLVSISSSMAEASALKSQAGFISDQYKINAKFQKFFAESTIKAGEREARAVASRSRQEVGSIRATAGGAGIEVNTGSALEAQAQAAERGAIDVVNVRSNAWRRAWGYKVEAGNLEGSAAMAQMGAKYKARSTVMTGGYNAVTDVMSGVTKYKVSQ